MTKAMLVVAFDEPEDGENLKLPLIASGVKGFFEEVDGVKIYVAVREAAEYVLEFLSGDASGDESNFVKHARRELELCGQTKSDPDFSRAIIMAVAGFASYGHSGGSHGVGVRMLEDLLQFKNLTPLTDNPDEWMDQSESSGYPMWQNTRNSEAFSQDGGKTYYLLSEGKDSADTRSIHESEKYTHG